MDWIGCCSLIAKHRPGAPFSVNLVEPAAIGKGMVMLFKAKELKGSELLAKDGPIGKVEEFYFDDKHWTVRYLVADTGGWLSGREVLISPYSLESIDEDSLAVSIDLTKKQIENSPALESNKPVSLQFEESFFQYYRWPMYWFGYYPWGESSLAINRQMNTTGLSSEKQAKKWDYHLRSTHAVTGYHVHAADGDAGHITDFILDDETWAIRYLVVETGTWLNGKKVLVSPLWIKSVSWEESKVFTTLMREEIRTSPEYTEDALLDQSYHDNLHLHYGREPYCETKFTLSDLKKKFEKDQSRDSSERSIL
jgi:uncharacterized protein YrrD